MKQRPRIKDPLRALDYVVTFLLIVYAAVAIVFGLGLAINGLPDNDGPACVVVEGDLLDPDVDSSKLGRDVGLEDDDFALLRTVELCDEDPDGRSALAADLNQAAGPIALLVVLIPLRNLVRTAQRTRLFSIGVARRTTLLGVVVMVAWLVEAVLRDVTTGVVVAGAVENFSWADALGVGNGFPLTEILVAAGLITTGRVLAWAVLLQEERDATI